MQALRGGETDGWVGAVKALRNMKECPACLKLAGKEEQGLLHKLKPLHSCPVLLYVPAMAQKPPFSKSCELVDERHRRLLP